MILPFLLEDPRAALLHHVNGPGLIMTRRLVKPVDIEVAWYKISHCPQGLCVLVTLAGWKEGSMSPQTQTSSNLMC